MLLKKGQLPILITNVCAAAAFGTYYLTKRNYEFVIYIGVIVFFLLLILATNRRVNYRANAPEEERA